MLSNIRDGFSLVLRVLFSAVLVVALSRVGSAQTLVGSPFVNTGYQGWQPTTPADALPSAGGRPAWSFLLTPDPVTGKTFLMETSDGRIGDGTTTGASSTADGQYKPYIMINAADTTPTDYTLDYKMSTVDDDGFGLVFGYQNEDNYFRVGFRQQASGSAGFGSGTSIQKVVGGVITQIQAPVTTFVPAIDGTEFLAKVIVTGNSYDLQISTGGNPFASILTGSDPNLGAGKYGIHSWAQHEASTSVPNYGTILGSVGITSTPLTKSTDFTNFVSPVPWRRLVMLDQNSQTGFETGGPNLLEDVGNFGLDVWKGVIRDDSNGNKSATAAAANVDFIGPAIVVDGPAAGAMTDYRYNVRVTNGDNDGIGLLFRAAEDGSFYRVNWNTEGPAVSPADITRPPRGMSIQKYKNGQWSQIYMDNQASPVFLPGDSVPFDVTVEAVGNQFKIDVLSDPNGAPKAYTYGVISDNSGDAILNGSVGLTNYGNGDGGNGAEYSAYNGNSTSLVTAITTFTDLSLTVDRTTGNVLLKNNAAVSANIKGVTVLAGSGAANVANWTSISDLYDGDSILKTVDTNDPWSEVLATPFSLSERENSGGNGGTLAAGQMVNLGNIWNKSKIEDLALKIELTDGNFLIGTASYINGPMGVSYPRSDLNFDGSVTPADWDYFFPNMLTNMSLLSAYQRAIKGDLDLDGDNDVNDFILFKADFEVANGAGSFAAMLGSVPEPSTFGLLLVAAVGAGAIRLRRRGKLGSLAICAMVIAGASSLTATEARAAVFAAQIDGTTGTVLHQTAGPTLFVGTQPAGDVGDLSLLLGGATTGTGGTPFTQATGMILANPNKLQYAAVGDRNLVETPGEQTATVLAGFPTGMWLSTTKASGSGAEVNYQVSMNSFKFADNWKAGHVRASNGTFFSGNNTGVTVTTQFNDPDVSFGSGHYKISIAGVDSRTDGMLFAIGESNSTSGRVVPVGILPDGSGWDVRVQTEGQNFPNTTATNFGYVYIPYGNTKFLRAAGNIQLTATSANVLTAVGGSYSVSSVDLGLNGTITPPGTPDGVIDAGRFLLKIPGKSDATGMLMIGTSAYATAGGFSGADDNLIAYEYMPSLGGWLVESYDLTGASLQNSDTYFAYFDYANPIEVGTPTPYNIIAEVNRADGTITLKNNSPETIGFDYYQIDSAAGSLNISGWNSLSDQNFEAIGGGIGESFDEAGGSSSSSLAEAFLKTESGFPELGIGIQHGLGMAYNNAMNAEDLVLTYHDSFGNIVTGLVTYIGVAPPQGIPGDFNNDMKVDAADYVVWRKDPANFPPNAYDTWRANFGNPPGSGSSLGGTSQVPEPASLSLVFCAVFGLFASRAGWRNR